MILQLANRHCKKIAGFFLALFYLSIVIPAYASTNLVVRSVVTPVSRYYPVKHSQPFFNNSTPEIYSGKLGKEKAVAKKLAMPEINGKQPGQIEKIFIGGPGQPEMSSFKSVGTDNMVNQFTGDFSYNIPLMDVGGYPINIYYDAGITPDQEASWVGLGFNINPGNINRNMRGVPDDFNGQDILTQVQKMKPNKTWGIGVGADLELFGIKAPVKAELGVGFNNYLGPSLSAGIRGSVSLFSVATSAGSEKFSAGANLNYGIEVNSRSGTSFNGGISFNANAHSKNSILSGGLGLTTGYNSRSGIKALQISEQFSFNSMQEKRNKDESVTTYRQRGNYTLYASSISFAKPSYVPSLRMPVTNTAWSARLQLGAGSFGLAADVEAEVYGQKSEVEAADMTQMKRMVGYLYYERAANNPDYVMDFTRFNDREVTPNTPVVSVPQYSYDVFSIQGEGTGGSIRAYRNDLGYVRDNTTTSKDRNTSAGGDIDPPGHFGGNFNTIKTPSTIGEWGNGNKLRNSIQFTQSNGTFENVYFRNPAEMTVIDEIRYSQLGGTDLVRFALGGTEQSPTIEPKLQVFDKSGTQNYTQIDLTQTPAFTGRNKRTQVVNFLTAEEASFVGLDKQIKSYNNNTILDPVADTLLYEAIPRAGGFRKPHHISQINVTEGNGKRYIYGVPVYNITQKDFTFSVNDSYSELPDKVAITPTQASVNSTLFDDKSGRDGYVQITTTPAYAHSFLLSGILSPDYVDVTGNGITEDDLGGSVKFNYTKIRNGSDTVHRWRTPLTQENTGNFNPGNRTEVKDDKAIISYGERESWYLQSVESKTMIAIFYLSNRLDGKGTTNEFGGINSTSNVVKKLDSIALFSKADLKKNGLDKAKSIKTVHFRYSYLLCQNTPDNPTGTAGINKGKLTLDSIFFTYNGKTRGFKNKYVFQYNSTGSNNQADNPDYVFASTDRWGTYKPKSANPGSMKNSDYPYSLQPASDKTVLNQNAAAWLLKKIKLPSGGQLEVEYESDDYAFVQNKRAAAMMKVVGFGSSSSFGASGSNLYSQTFPNAIENEYVFIQVPVSCSNAADVYRKYLQGTSQLAFKLWVQMPKGGEYIPCYGNFGSIENTDYGVDTSNSSVIWVKLQRVGGKSALSLTALEYLRQQLPGQAFKGYDVAGDPPLKQVGDMLLGMLASLRDAFTDPINAFRKDGKARQTDLSKCFVRLNVPDGFKYGGGHRVKAIKLRDNWKAMTGQYTSVYGQQYDYSTTESFNGSVRTISSGVASYEPSVGGEENPWQSMIQIEDYLPLGPTSYGAIEMPVLDAFFPAPVVGYSKVTVTSIKTNTDTTKKSRSGIGKQVTEYYTAKDFPVYYSYTPFDAGSVKEFHQSSTQNFFNKYGYDFKAQSQGFLVATNDMHGKMKSQSSYAENDSLTPINYTQHFYRNTGTNGLSDQFSFVSKENSGALYSGNMGVDVELMTDTREFSVKANSFEIQSQVDIFYLGLVVFPVPTVWPLSGVAENIYRSVTTTKVVSYHGVLDSIVVIDKGSMVSTKNLVYDAHTGEVLVSRTNNEFNQPVYATSYPAHWAYSGMGLAYKNINATYKNVNFVDGKITSGMTSTEVANVFESGDELYIINPGTSTTCLNPSSPDTKLVWVYDKNKNSGSLTNVSPDFIFLDQDGKIYNRMGVQFRIVRSGKRNMLDAKVESVTSLLYPIVANKLFVNTNSNVVNATAIEYKEKWQTDNDVIRKVRIEYNALTCSYVEIEDQQGSLEKNINPYRKGLLGNFRSWRSMVFYDGRKEYDTTANTNIFLNGQLKNFKLYWDFSANSNLIPDTLSSQWVWNNKINKLNAKGLELETVDALGIYTSAQYGYDKTMPVAIVNNAASREFFVDGFEDYEYGESLNNAKYNFRRKHIDFSNISNSYLVNTDSTAFKAHSGKYVLAVKNGSTSTKLLNVSSSQTESYWMNFGSAATNTLSNPGINFDAFEKDDPNSWTISANASSYTMDNTLDLLATHPQPANGYKATVRQSQYFEVPQNGNYTLSQSAASGNILFPVSTVVSISSIDGAFNVQYFTPIPAEAGWSSSYNSGYQSAIQNTVFLCKGIYKIEIVYSVLDTYYSIYNPPNSQLTFQYSFQSSTTGYKNYSNGAGCAYTLPVAGDVSMFNPIFTNPSAKKMLFSAWVREECGNISSGIPCKEYTYKNNQIQINFGGSTLKNETLNPSGPIIDGWQRYEGVFASPVGATDMSLNFVNSGTKTIFFDDIRIHPFNSNMKSYVYDPVSLRLVAEQDANNYSTFYEYDEEGKLIRTKVETKEGIKTVTETRSALQRIIN